MAGGLGAVEGEAENADHTERPAVSVKERAATSTAQGVGLARASSQLGSLTENVRIPKESLSDLGVVEHA